MAQPFSTQAIEQKSPMFVSLGMIVLDELHFSSQTARYDVPGGSGLYERIFRYLTPQLQPRPVDLEKSELLGSQSFHFLAGPELLQEMVRSLLSLLTDASRNTRPLIVWEPAPLSCKRELLDEHMQACRLVDIFSPNHEELKALMQDGEPERSLPFLREDVERGAASFLDAGIGPEKQGLVVIRCGEHGCLTLSQRTGVNWSPPFYEPASPRIADTTGAGNAFLGGFAVGWLQTEDVREAAIFGSVAASFALEQIGLPVFSPATSTSDETWNEVHVSARLEEYRRKLPAVRGGTV
ncbi:hypothetical protein LLEC1_00382 [Akanthomyces lecanii]|uniref:Carbohydrate kinase PfkB domain-containing protein n=1 Tax=Cordyceps confragosa TaxID=2714763 RepID=A0A179I1X2_CORDF|nr:hypothetical protein LLEC1_00382 [Akanthomyces lecanii]